MSIAFLNIQGSDKGDGVQRGGGEGQQVGGLGWRIKKGEKQ